MGNGKLGRPPKYTAEFRKNAVDYYLVSGKGMRECGEDLGIPYRTLGKWVQDLDADDPDRALASELRALRKEVDRLRMENEFLKKAEAFFAANQGWSSATD